MAEPDVHPALTREVVQELHALLDGPHAAVRALSRERLCELDLPAGEGLSREAYRDLVLDWCCELARKALTFAMRWGERRRQFGTGLDMDTPLMDYLTHQRRLLPAIATSYALQSAHDHLTAAYVAVLDDPGGPEQREVEALAAGLKAVATWHMTDAVQDARECCGGKGYLTENRFASLRADSDVFTTFEGDNMVLLQLVAKTLLSDYASQFEDLDAVGMAKHLTTRQVGRFFSETGRWVASPATSRSCATTAGRPTR
jgi:hypothetical protein